MAVKGVTNVLTSAAAANIGSIMGIGFPPNTGGAAPVMTGHESATGELVLATFVARADDWPRVRRAVRLTAYIPDMVEKGESFLA